jgi:S1-C subfamily serine protease
MKNYQCSQCQHHFAAPEWLGVAATCPDCGGKNCAVASSSGGVGQQMPGNNSPDPMILSRLLVGMNQKRVALVAGFAIAVIILLGVIFVRLGGTNFSELFAGGDRQAIRQNSPASGSVYDNALQSTVWIVCETDNEEIYMGTGSVVDRHNKLVLTNHHVIDGAKDIYVYAPAYDSQGHVIADGSYYLQGQEAKSARVRASDPSRDLAVLALNEPLSGVRGINFSASSARPGQNVHTIGNSGEDIEGGLWIYTSGTVRQVYVHASGVKIIETQNPINSGDSGGPVVDDDGKLVAVTMSYIPEQRLVSRAVDIEEVKKFMDAFRDP